MKKVAMMLGLTLAAMEPGIAQAAAEDVVVEDAGHARRARQA